MRHPRHSFSRSSLVALSAVALSAVALAAAPSIARAQEVGGPWRVQPTAGLWVQPDIGNQIVDRVGQFVGLEVSRQRSARTRLTASTGYYRLGEAYESLTTAQGQPRTEVYRAENIPLSAGVADDLWQSGRAAVSVGLEAGALWQRNALARSTGPEPLGGTSSVGWTPIFVTTPAVAVRRALGPRLEVTAAARALVFGEPGPDIISAFSAGFAWRP